MPKANSNLTQKARLLDISAKVLGPIVLVEGVLFILLYLFVALSRMDYPFELEWLEGGLLEQVQRIVSTGKLYVRPSIDFVTFVYTPIYLYAAAGLSKLTGVSFFPLRIISFIASLGCFALIFAFVKRETKNLFSAALAACFFAATFQISGAWLDIGRVDSLLIFFLLLAIYNLRLANSHGKSIAAGAFLALSFLTKQTALTIGVPMVVYLLIVNWKQAISFMAALIGVISIVSMVMDHIHGGWYNYYILNFTSRHFDELAAIVLFWPNYMAPVSVAMCISLFYISYELVTTEAKNFLFFLLVPMGMIGVSWLCTTDIGSYHNVVLPAYAAIAILFGLGIDRAMNLAERTSSQTRDFIKSLILVACAVQLICLAYNPIEQIPTSEDLKEGKWFVDRLAHMEGEVLIPSHPYLERLAGKKSHAHNLALYGVVRGNEGEPRTAMLNDTVRALESHRFKTIILDQREEWLSKEINKYYVEESTVPYEKESSFRPVTGGKTRPEIIYVPKQ